MSMRWILSLLLLLVGLLTARQFVGHSPEPAVARHPLESAEEKHVAVKEMAVRLRQPAVAATPECDQMWDSATHMSKLEWIQVCRRIEGESRR
jgi:hypothetical protein